ncbi:hypothetical protein HMPREF1575_01253 [Gardnerella vaginalis JCP7672]|nr:hypothetical protein HMPREF1575_01253 [Gardnerella vaginalis JCP7672]
MCFNFSFKSDFIQTLRFDICANLHKFFGCWRLILKNYDF